MKKGRVNAKYDNLEYIKSNRTFPIGKTILLFIIIVLQIGLILFSIFYEPKPQDVIHQYNVTVNPLEDGSLDIEYYIQWEALDPDEELTWIELGMANENYSVYPDSLSSNISNYNKYFDGEGYASIDLYFDQPYTVGDKFEIYFKINQKDMLCQNEKGYFYEFVPTWFNKIQVKQYKFLWLMDDSQDYISEGSLDYGEYHKMNIQYNHEAFLGCDTIRYYPFDDDGAYNEIFENKLVVIFLCAIAVILLLVADIYIVDSHISYNRGRGFLRGHGYYVHTFGRRNPYYIRAHNAYNASHAGHFRSRGGGGGCACACACACAGGGRAGCSQKDTFGD